jgi:hypothetical protein
MDFFQGNRKKPVVDPHAPIPVGDAVETDWAAWEELVVESEPLTKSSTFGDLS